VSLPSAVVPAERLEDLPFFAGADPALLARHRHRATWRGYAPGEVVVDFDDPTTEVFLIASGTVRVAVRSAGGRELVLNEIGAGDIIGEIAAIDGAPRSANVTTTVRSRLCALPADAFLDIVYNSPAVCERLLRRLAAKLRLQTERALEREALSVRQRLCAELLRLSRPRPAAGGGAGEPAARVVSPPPPQHEIAARIGARREAVSREMTDLERLGLLQRSPTAIVLPAPARLRALVEEGLRDGTAAI
jgi:CRP/FNR family transcriptional regulator, cyclic AMP receptor protein